ncbi:MAG: hypothetical protein AB7U75_21310 [Hyphomicrobiaceae bacterium]
MEFLDQYAEHIGEILSWLSNPDTTIPVIKLLQGLAAIIGALVSALGFYKAWRFAESKLGKRLSEFLEQEHANVVLARKTVRDFRDKRSAVKHARLKIFTNYELRKALRQVRGAKIGGAEAMLLDSLSRTKEREDLARQKAALHQSQRAMAHLLLGAIEDSRSDHRAALAHFQAALEIDEYDVEALEYLGLQLLKLGDSAQALDEFEKLAEIAKKRGNQLLLAHAYRNCGLAYDAPPNSSPFNANIAYKNAIEAFPSDGPPLDIGYIHELRGRVNIKLKNSGQAHRSLMSALTRYSQIELTRNRDSREAAEGVRRIHAFLADLDQLQNGTTTVVDDGDPQPETASVTTLQRSFMMQLSDQKPENQTPSGKSPN